MRYPLIDAAGQLRLDRQRLRRRPCGTPRRASSRLATEMLRDIDADTVDFGPNYDESRQEPLVLPARFPNLLVNGSSGIAVGMATNIPPHNLRETIDAVMAYIDDPTIDVERPDEAHQGPRLPDRRHHRRARRASATPTRPAAAAWSSAAARTSSRCERGKEAIIVTEMPYQVYKGDGRGDGSGLMQEDRRAGRRTARIKEISDLRDESDKSGIRLVIELKRDAIPKVVLNKLYKHTQLQTTFGVNMVALVDGVPRTLGLLPIDQELRRPPARRHRAAHEARAARGARRGSHILEGLLVALDNIDAVIELIRGSRDPDAARDGLIERFELVAHPGAGDPRPAPPAPHRARDRTRSRRSTPTWSSASSELREILGDEARGHGPDQGGAARDQGHATATSAAREITALRGRDRHRGPDRRPADGHRDHALRLHQVAPARDLPPAEARRRRRDRDGHEGRRLHRAPLRELDARLPAVLHEPRQGLPPEGLRAARGLAHGEGPRARQPAAAARGRARPGRAQATRDFTEGKYLVFATRKGQIKKTEFLAYNTPIKADGIIAIKIRDDDELVAVRRTSGDDDIIMVSRSGQAARFNEDAGAADGPRHRRRARA